MTWTLPTVCCQQHSLRKSFGEKSHGPTCMSSLPVRSSSSWYLKGGKNGWLFILRVQLGPAPPGGICPILVAKVQEGFRAAIQLQGPEHLLVAPVLHKHRTKGRVPYAWKWNSTDAIDANLLASGNKHSHISAVFTGICFRCQLKQQNSKQIKCVRNIRINIAHVHDSVNPTAFLKVSKERESAWTQRSQ